MTELYENPNVPDVEFCIMGIGDLAYDAAPIQISQFESDIRIAEQLDQLYFEFGGGGNKYESYSAAWYMGINHCKLDCWDRRQKGIIITMGDELPNPYLPAKGMFGGGLGIATGDKLQGDIETSELLEETKKKFDIYHISIDDVSSSYEFYKQCDIDKKWKDLLGNNYQVCSLDVLPRAITEIVSGNRSVSYNDSDVVSW